MHPTRTSSLRTVRFAAAAAVVSLLAVAPAQADGAKTEHAPAAPVSNDFYLRAGLAIDRSASTRFSDPDCHPPLPGHFYGCGPGVDGAPYSSHGDFGTMLGFELGIGYVAFSPVRLEASVQYRPSFAFKGEHNYNRRNPRSVSADLSSRSAFLSAYFDLPASGPAGIRSLRPFVGGGVGLSRIEIDETRINFPITFVTLPGGHRTNFAWMLTAGFAAPLGERAILDLAWRYTNSGAVDTGPGTARTECRTPGCGRASTYLVPETRADLRSHGLSVSVRYPF